MGAQTQEVPPQHKRKVTGSLPWLLILGKRSPSPNSYSQLTFQILSSCLPSCTQAGMMTSRSSLLDRKVATPMWYKSSKYSIRISSSVFRKCLLAPAQTGAQDRFSAEVRNATSSLTISTLYLQTAKEVTTNITHKYTKRPQNFI